MKIQLAIIILLLCSSPMANGQELNIKTTKELISQAKEFDGRPVLIQGEVIGSIMPRGDFAWINIEDTSGVIGVWAPLALTKTIHSVGNYKGIGDRVEVEGIFARSDPELLGEMGVRAQRISIVKPGEPIYHQIHPVKGEVAAGLFVWAASLWFIRWVIKRRWRAGK